MNARGEVVDGKRSEAEEVKTATGAHAGAAPAASASDAYSADGLDDEDRRRLAGAKANPAKLVEDRCERTLPRAAAPHSWALLTPHARTHLSGPYVYELFAVLVHSGGALGGHYYAYIKNVDSNQWFTFNDSSVSPMTESEVLKAFGGEEKRRSMASSWWGAPSTRSTTATYYTVPRSANAYMLMYRQVDSSRNQPLPSGARPLGGRWEAGERARLSPISTLQPPRRRRCAGARSGGAGSAGGDRAQAAGGGAPAHGEL